MTTWMMFDDDVSPEGITRRIREELARRGIGSDAKAARNYDRPQQWLSRHMNGQTDWKLQDLHDFCVGLELDYTYIVSGIRTFGPNGGLPVPPRPAPDDQIRRRRAAKRMTNSQPTGQSDDHHHAA